MEKRRKEKAESGKREGKYRRTKRKLRSEDGK